jgi:toxin ParE1/3/4
VKKVLLNPAAESDVIEIIDWYDEIAPAESLGFARELRRCKMVLAGRPTLHPYVQKPYRRILMRTYPYLIIYIDEPRCVTIVAVVHGKRHPNHWRSRL